LNKASDLRIIIQMWSTLLSFQQTFRPRLRHICRWHSRSDGAEKSDAAATAAGCHGGTL